MKHDIGKIPPQAVDIEEIVLGAIMLEKDAIIKVLDNLIPESFYKDAHQHIYRAMTYLNDNSNPIDILTVCDILAKNKKLDEVGGQYYVASLTSRVASASNIEYHSLVLKNKYNLREIIRIASETIELAYNETDCEDILLNQDKQLLAINSSGGDCQKLINVVNEKLAEIEKIQKGEIKLSGVPSNLKKIDSRTCGWQPTDLIIVGARPSIGKTAFALKILYEAASSGNPVLCFSLEMSASQLALRIISKDSGYTHMELKQGRFYDWSVIDNKLRKLENLEFYIDDTAYMTINKIRSIAYNYVRKLGIKLIVIDYLQLIKGSSKGQNRENEISDIARGLKILAKELNIPIIALCQLSRAVESRADKKPILSDLRESGAIEQDADIVIFLRDDSKFFDLPELKNKKQLDFAKYRNGAVGEIELTVNEGTTDFFDEPFTSQLNRNTNFDDTPF